MCGTYVIVDRHILQVWNDGSKVVVPDDRSSMVRISVSVLYDQGNECLGWNRRARDDYCWLATVSKSEEDF
jgi:hypothetical protein